MKMANAVPHRRSQDILFDGIFLDSVMADSPLNSGSAFKTKVLAICDAWEISVKSNEDHDSGQRYQLKGRE